MGFFNHFMYNKSTPCIMCVILKKKVDKIDRVYNVIEINTNVISITMSMHTRRNKIII